ncbi:MAG: carboxypeptidase-like regulatory domain-containing protein [Calditrichia bacterium]
MRRYFAFSMTFLLPFLLSPINSANAQNSVSGVLTASDNDNPLPYANIYLSNTTIGTSSDPDGFFSIRSIPSGRYELVVQYVGYELFVKNIDLGKDDKLRLNVKLVPKPYAGEEVVVEAPDAKWWRKRLEEFTREFLGPNPFASECRILNATALEFVPAPDIDGYKVATDSIIVAGGF